MTLETEALQYAARAEQAAGKVDALPPDVAVRPIRSAGVIGAGTMGTGIAMSLVNARIEVALVEAGADALERGLANIRRQYDSAVTKGRITAAQRDERLALIRPTLEYAGLEQADLLVEAVFEDLQVKREVFTKLDAVARPGAILASNTSTLDLDRIAAVTQRPDDVIGMHFFSPAQVMRLLEVVRGKATAHDVLATVMQLAPRIGKVAVVARVCDGFIGNRMIEQYLRQAFFLLDEGATVQQVDAAVEAFGFAMGPFRMSDLAGNDIGWHIRKRRYREYPDMRYSRIADRLCELGRFGQKTGAGWYDYRPGDRTAHPAKAVQELVEQHRDDLGLEPRAITDDEIVDRLVYALINEGAHLLEEGIAQRASDIDVVYLAGYGFPAGRGGPMWHADHVGLETVVGRMREFATNPHGDPNFWQPAPLLTRLAENGETLTGEAPR